MPENIDNLELHPEGNYAIVSINPGIFPLQVIYSASYSLMDRAYIVIDGNPEEEVVVTLRPKKGKDIEKLGREFNNELINYAVHMVESRRTEKIRNEIVKKALQGHMQKAGKNEAYGD